MRGRLGCCIAYRASAKLPGHIVLFKSLNGPTPCNTLITEIGHVTKSGSVAESVGKRAVEKTRSGKSPTAGLSHYAWKSRTSSGITTFPPPRRRRVNFLILVPLKNE